MKQTIIILSSILLALTTQRVHADERTDFFEVKIRPILTGTCFRCHGGARTSGALRVDSRESLLKGGESGPALDLKNPEASLLIRALRRQDDVSAMPPEKDKALRPDQVDDVLTWIKSGAVWPAGTAKFASAKHWAFEPIRDFSIPVVHDRAWVKTSVDSFIRARQEAAGIRPAPPADKLTLIRRATFDLTGLPPTPAEVKRFLEDPSPTAYAQVVDRLLQSPAYGERWGRHWLDVVRYADTAGDTADYPVPEAWRYRNYVIDALNADKPYDEFLREQIAGDVLALQGPPQKYAERVTATGYLALSRRFGFDSENYHHLTIQDTIDTLGQSVLGLSIGCARCHDHKFDPVTMNDYYALFGIFDSSRYAFPGSEQKQKVRSLAPLLPPVAALAKGREFDLRVSELIAQLARKNQPAPAGVLRSLAEMDGDFELQAAAAGGSNGVLVPPWIYEGKVAVTNEAQSPFKNLYPSGKVGVSIPAGAASYRITQALHPARTRKNRSTLYVNFDFRVAAPGNAQTTGAHCFTLGGIGPKSALQLLISSGAVSLRTGEKVEPIGKVQPNQWINLQLTLDLKSQHFQGRLGRPGAITEFSGLSFGPGWSGIIDTLTLGTLPQGGTPCPAIEFDNLGVQDLPIPPVSLQSSTAGADNSIALLEQLKLLVGTDGDLELQSKNSPPAFPWNPGPNSVVKVSESSQSPFRNIFEAGRLGFHLPGRAEYDGFGLTFPRSFSDRDPHLFASFDFRNGDNNASGSWRYYLGHGPGNSAAIELFFNGLELCHRDGATITSVCRLMPGTWYQVQLHLDLKARTYAGTLTSPKHQARFSGRLVNGWDARIDYLFIDSYGHITGVRPALDADNFVVSDKPLPSFDAQPVRATAADNQRSLEVAKLRKQLNEQDARAGQASLDLRNLLAQGPFPMAYGMAEGTPHDVRKQMRGEPDQPGAEVRRGFVRCLGGQPLPAETVGSGRLELAAWLTKPDNPLTARVMANRIWKYHFGRGLVKTPNDFGIRGLPPTHPELLDHLATQFIRSGWSIKAMHRLVMLSATYQQSALAERPANGSHAPADLTDLYASFSRRRLSAEEIRDSILEVSGDRDSTPAQGHPFPPAINWGYTQHAPFSAVYDHNQRSVYLMTQRLKRHRFLALFDGADPNATTPERLITTVPTQALFFLNDPFVHARAESWAKRLLAAEPGEGQRIERAWLQAIGRSPTPAELAEATEFLGVCRAELTATGLKNVEAPVLATYLRTLFGSNEFLFID